MIKDDEFKTGDLVITGTAFCVIIWIYGNGACIRDIKTQKERLCNVKELSLNILAPDDVEEYINGNFKPTVREYKL